METFTRLGVTKWISMIRMAYYCKKLQLNNYKYADQYRKNQISSFARNGSNGKEIEAFFDWIISDEGQKWFAQKSPSNAATVAIRNKMRLCPEAEKFILEKAKDRGKLLEYCMTFGIVLDNMERVTLKAAFGDDAEYQKKYIKHIEENKRKVKQFLAQLVSVSQVDPNQTVQELLDTL